MELPSRYDPKPVEERWYRIWEEKGVFRADASSGKPPYTIVLPPPNITGILTLGHVLNMTIQDILIRSKRMQGYEALWLPGTDHAGIATQNKVEEKLRKEGKTRYDLGREKFLEEVWKWKEEYHGRIVYQMRRLGLSCDWSRERFTMDEGFSNAVLEVFVRLYEKGLIYRDEYIVNYCPRCRTVLSNDEVEHKEIEGKLWYIKYPLKDGGYITVATTRPETMLGDTAVAVHPDDERYREFQGKTVILPFVEREIPVIADPAVDPEFGTGAVKVTPGHDPNDFEIGKKHGLPIVKIFDEKGFVNENGGKFCGLERFEARNKIVEELESMGLLEKIEPHTHSVGHCYRCGTIIEPWVSPQWFVRMKPLAEPARKVVEEDVIKFQLPRWKKVYFHWIDNIRDWVISRQLWWGHRIPAYHCEECGEITVSKEKPEKCKHCGSTKIKQDEDVLDTWFSSWLWPFATMGWPEETGDLKKFYPTTTLVTGWDIIFLWVARMIMAGLEFMGKIPFEHVYFTGMVRDHLRRKLSKSLGNSPDPIDLIEEYGADALRMGMMLITPEGQDVLYSKERIEIGRNFANKIWNASRFILMNLDEDDRGTIEGISLELPDRWIISRVMDTIKTITDALDNFRINEAAKTIYDRFWHEFCDWYLEEIKVRLYGKDEYKKKVAKSVALWALENYLKLLHPFMPFITEEIWNRLPGERDLLCTSSWPSWEKNLIEKEIEEKMQFLMEFVEKVRNVRGEFRIPPKQKIRVILRGDGDKIKLIKDEFEWISFLAGIEEIKEGEREPLSASVVLHGVEAYVPLKDIIDVERERKRVEKEKEQVEHKIKSLRARLSNAEFLEKAPVKVVEETEEKLKKLEEKYRVLERIISDLSLDKEIKNE